MWVPYSAVQGKVGRDYKKANSVVLNATITSGTQYGTSYYCYAWDADYLCSDPVYITGEVGTVQVTFTKIPDWAMNSDQIQTEVSNGAGGPGKTVVKQEYISDNFLNTAYGSIIDTDFSVADTGPDYFGMGFAETISSTGKVKRATLSELLEDKASEKVLQRLRALEKLQQADIAKWKVQ
jgi:hypothetical protein